jgi:SprT protein
LEYCLDLCRRYPFKLRLSRSRITKAGDFCTHKNRTPEITINEDLAPFTFLLTFLHEFSHHAVYLVYGPNKNPHGKEWKLAFRTFTMPMIEAKIFPEDLSHVLSDHLRNPMVSSFSDVTLTKILRKYDPKESGKPTLENLKNGDNFRFQGKIYKLIKKIRTRYLCEEEQSGRKYLISVLATPE